MLTLFTLLQTLQKQASHTIESYLFSPIDILWLNVSLIQHIISEFNKLSNYLEPFQVLKFEADAKILNTYMDGGVAIVDQIICSQAK